MIRIGRLNPVAGLILLVALYFATVCPVLAAEDTLVYSWLSKVGELNPHTYSPNQMFAQAMLYESLVKYAEGNTVIPWLAEKWTVSAD